MVDPSRKQSAPVGGPSTHLLPSETFSFVCPANHATSLRYLYSLSVNRDRAAYEREVLQTDFGRLCPHHDPGWLAFDVPTLMPKFSCQRCRDWSHIEVQRNFPRLLPQDQQLVTSFKVPEAC